MQELNLFLVFLSPLNRLGLPYMVTGAIASSFYGQPRLTHDLDLVLAIMREDASRLAAAFPPEAFYCPPVEVIGVEADRPHRGHFNLIHLETGFKADVYIAGQDRLHLWAMQRRRELTVAGESFWIAPIEYVILRKLEYYREGGSSKHLSDIAGMLAVSSESIDFDQIEAWVLTLGLEEVWQAAKALKGK